MQLDLQKLKIGLTEWEQQKQASNAAFWRTHGEAWDKVHQGIYTEADVDRELAPFIQQLNVVDSLVRPLVLDFISAYLMGTADERATIRDVFSNLPCAAYALLDFIVDCSKRLDTSDNEEIFRLALAAASIENCGHDFRDTNAVLAEIAIGAFKVGINIEPVCSAIAAISSADRSKGGWPTSMQSVLADFHNYAPKAVRLF